MSLLPATEHDPKLRASGRQSKARVKIFAGLALLLLSAGCANVYAPAVRSPHGGMPGRLDAGDMSVAADVIMAPYDVPPEALVWGPTVAYSVLDWFQIEAGLDINRYYDDRDCCSWMLGFVGARKRGWLAVKRSGALGGCFWGITAFRQPSPKRRTELGLAAQTMSY